MLLVRTGTFASVEEPSETTEDTRITAEGDTRITADEDTRILPE